MGKKKNKKSKSSYRPQETGGLDISALMASMNSGGKNMGSEEEMRGIVLDADYVHAPYNFIPQWNIIQKISSSDFKSHDVMDENLYSGRIAYTLRALTPIFIGNGKKNEEADFVKNMKGQYVIPGSSIRGMIRTNAQILGFADISEDVDDYSLMYRRVGSASADALKSRYDTLLGATPINLSEGGSISILQKVKAGYIVKNGKSYRIFGTAIEKINNLYGDMNYYIIGERKILEDYRDYVNGGKNGDFAYDALITEEGNLLAHKPRWSSDNALQIDPFEKIKISKDIHYRGSRNEYYLPKFFPISYELSGRRNVTAVRAPGTCSLEGYALLTGPMNEKKAVYIIPALDRDKELFVLNPNGGIYSDDLQSFRIDYKKRENTLVLRNYPDPDREVKAGYKAFFNLPENDDEVKPVFYFSYRKHIYFGFTPHLRLYFDYTIHDGINNMDQSGYDIVKSVFGYARRKDSRKGKVYFSDAVAEQGQTPGAAFRISLQEPKPTNYYAYLSHDDGHVATYNDLFSLSGVKQYWLHSTSVPIAEVTNPDITSEMRPLPARTVFGGTVRFENMTMEELGLLLWSMKLESSSCMNIGKGKPYGYGVVKMEIIEDKAEQIVLEKSYDLTKNLALSPFKKLDIDNLINTYKKKVAELYKKSNVEDVMNIPSIKAFFRMKDYERLLPESKIGYMGLSDYKKQINNNAVLPTVMELDQQLLSQNDKHQTDH